MLALALAAFMALETGALGNVMNVHAASMDLNGNMQGQDSPGVNNEKKLTISDFKLDLPTGMSKDHVNVGTKFDVVMRIKNNTDKDISTECMKMEWLYTDTHNKRILESDVIREAFEGIDYTFKAGQEQEIHFPVNSRSDMMVGSLRFYRIVCDTDEDSEDSWRNWFVLKDGKIQYYDNGYCDGAVAYNGQLDFKVDYTKPEKFEPSLKSYESQIVYYEETTPDIEITYNSGKNSKVIPESEYTVTYDKPIKGVGEYTFTVKFKNGYKGIITEKFRVIPMYPKFDSLKSGKKKMTVKWRYYNQEADGCQIQYTRNKNFKKNVKTIRTKKVTSKKLKKLKAKKRYYVRIRTYKKAQGKTYYSAWTKVKSVKVKK